MAGKSRTSRDSGTPTTSVSSSGSASAESALQVAGPSNAQQAEEVKPSTDDGGYLGELGAFEMEGAEVGQAKGQSGARVGGGASAPPSGPTDPHSGLGNGAVKDIAAQGASGSGSSLPHLDRIQSAFGGYDVSGIRAHTDGAATGAIGANAYTTGADVVFAGSPSLETAAEEATHSVLQGAGKGPSGGVGQEGDSFEQHADAVAKRVASGGSAEDLLDGMTGGDRSVTPGKATGVQREAAPAAAPAAEAEGPAAPQTVALNTPAGQLHVDVPAGAQAGGTVTARPRGTPVAGLNVNSVTISFDENFNAKSGTADVSVDRGAVSGSGQLQIADNTVTGNVGVELTTPVGSGQGQAEIQAGGIASTGSIQAPDLRLSNGLTANSGTVAWSQTAEGVVEAGGQVGGNIPTVGDYALDLLYSEGAVSGETTVTLAERTLLGSAKILSGQLQGRYYDEEMVVQGPMALGIGEWAQGTSDGSVNISTKSVTGGGDITVSEVSYGDVALHSGTVGVSVEDNAWTGGRIDVDASAKDFGGQAQGTFDPAANTFDGTMAATYQNGQQGQEGGGAPAEGGGGAGVRILGASGQLGIEQNRATELSNANARVGIDIAGEQKIEAGVEGASYDVEARTVSGRAVGATTSPVSLAGGALELNMSSAAADVQSNTVTQVAGASNVKVGAPGGEKVMQLDGQGTVDPVAGNVQEASGTASLLKVPMNLGANLAITSLSGQGAVANNTLESTALDAGWQSESFEGTAQGGFDPQEQKIDGQVSASVRQPKDFGAGVTLDSGSGNVVIEENDPKSFQGSAAGKLGSKIEYDAQTIDVDIAQRKVDGQVQAGLQEGQEVGLQNVGKLEAMNAEGTVAENQLERVQGELAGKIEPGGSELLDFNVTGAYRATDEVVESARGDVSLTSEKQLGPITLDRLDATASVTENSPTLESANVGFHTDKFEGSIEGTEFDVENRSVTGTANATLKAPITVGALEISSAEGAVDVTANELGTMQGTVTGKVTKGDKTIDFSAENVGVDVENEEVSGTVKASTSDHLDIIPNTLKAKLTDAEGQIESNDLKQLSGGIEALVAAGGQDRLKIGATGDYDADQNKVVQATGEVELMESFGLFGDKLSVEEFVGSGTITENELQSGAITARAELGAVDEGTNVIFDGNFTRADDGFDIAGSAEIDQFDIIKPNDKGRHLSGGMTGTVDTAADTFSVGGSLDYAINESFGGDLEGEMDQEFDPALKGTLRGNADLVQATELFSIEKTIVSIPIPPIFGASLDARLAMSVGQLSVAPEIGITEEWRPLTAATDLPDFETTTNAQWGVNLEGALLPYLYGGLRMPGVKAAVGGVGKAALSADAGVNAQVQFSGKDGEFGGEVGLGVNVTGNLDLGAGLFAELGVLGWDVLDWQKEDMVSYTLSDLFNLDWSKTFKFGDAGPSEEEGADVPVTQLDPAQDSSRTGEATPETSRPEKNTETSNDASVQGGPSIGGDSALESLNRDQKSADGDEEMSGLERAMNALEAMKALYDSAGGAVQQLADFPMGTFQLIWDIFRGRFDFQQILDDARAVYDSLTDLMEYVAPMLQGWFTQFWDFIKSGPPNLLKALWGDSGAFRAVINDGITIQNAPSEMLIHLLEGALWDDMWTSAADEAACLRVMRVAVSRGLIDRILTPERTRSIFEELDTYGSEFKQIVLDNAPASVLRSEVERYTGHWWLSGSEEREALMWIEAANRRGILRSVLTQDAASNILSGMDGSNYTRMREIMRNAGYRV